MKLLAIAGFILPIIVFTAVFYSDRNKPTNGVWPPEVLYFIGLVAWEVVWAICCIGFHFFGIL